MPTKSLVKSTAADVWSDCRNRLRPLIVAGLVWRLVSALLLPMLYAALILLVVAGSGNAVLTDLDLLYFVTSPIGVLGLLLLGAVFTSIYALEVGTLLTILSSPDGKSSFVDALRYTLASAPRLFGIAIRLVIETLLWLLPAILIGGVSYYGLLSKFDINYYLVERPPSFLIATGIALLLCCYLLFVFIKVLTVWFLALPIGLYEGTQLKKIRELSRARTLTERWSVRGWLAGWLAASGLFSITVTFVLGTTFWLVGSFWPRSLMATAIGIGLVLTLTILANIVVNFVSSLALVALVRRIYLRLGGAELNQTDSKNSSQKSFVWLTKARLITFLVIAFLGITTLGFASINSIAIEDKVVVIGHRGSPLSAPGNSLSSIRAAIIEKADWIEIDVQETADGEIVVFHDSDFMSIAGMDLKIWEATTEQLAKFDLGAKFDSQFADERIPTLAEVLAECQGKVGVVIELKEYGHGVDLVNRVVKIVEQFNMDDQTMFMSLDRESVERVQALRPNWRVGLLLSIALGKTSQLEVDFLGINASFASRSTIRTSHRSGHDVYAWTVNDPITISSLISRGVDGIITDQPAVANAVLEERSTMPPVVRLLIDLADRFQVGSSKLAELYE